MANNSYPHCFKKKYTPNLKGYIGQCETNYWRLHRLLPFLEEEDERVFGVDSHSEEEDQVLSYVSCKVVERCKYTTTISLVQESTLTDWFPKPTIIVRMYHDAQMAEVMSFQRNRYIQAVYSYPNKKMHQPDEKAQNNAFLGEWLSHCLMHGISLNAVSIETK